MHLNIKPLTGLALLQGHDQDPGIVQLALEEIFNAIKRSKGRDFLLGLSMLEIYNEVSFST